MRITFTSKPEYVEVEDRYIFSDGTEDEPERKIKSKESNGKIRTLLYCSLCDTTTEHHTNPNTRRTWCYICKNIYTAKEE